MKTTKLLQLAEHVFSPRGREACAHEDCIRELLKRLKKKENLLKDQLRQSPEGSKERRLARRQLEILYLQRRRGLMALKRIK